MNGWMKKIGLGAAGGLIIGPLLGLAFIKMTNVAYLEISFAIGGLIAGFTLGAIICMIFVSFLDDILTRTTLALYCRSYS